MGNDRKKLNISNEDDETIDLTSFINGDDNKTKTSKKDIKKMVEAGEEQGFVSREPRKRHKTPYTVQLGVRVRVGMKDIIQGLGILLSCSDTSIIEKAIGALIEKEGNEELKQKYKELTK